MIIGIFDFEMSNLNADFGMLLCGVIKNFRGKSQTFRLDQYPGYEKDRANDKALAKDLRDALEQFDIWVSYNGRRFDVPFLNSRLLYHGLRPVEKKKHIDILYQARYKLKLHSSRLASVQEHLGLRHEKTEIKANHWMRAVAGYKPSMDYIVRHCVADVNVLEDTYEALKQFVTVIYA